MAIQSYEFDSGRSAACADFRAHLYRNDLNWIPPLRAAFLAQFAPEFSFFQRPGNHHRNFIAVVQGKIVGHVSALVNRDLKDRDGTPVGTLGFFECVDDYAVAADLLEHAINWLEGRNDLHRIWAPVNFDIWHGYRFMIRGFGEKIFFGEPYNKVYYPGFFSRFGFTVKKTWDSLERDGQASLETMIARFAPRYRMLLDQGYQFNSLDLSRSRDLHQLYTVLIRSYHGLLGITPFEFGDFERILGQSLKAFEARFANLIYKPDGDIAAFSVAYPDYTDAIRAMRGNDDLFVKLRFHFHHRKAKRVIFYMIGATPEEVESRHGVGGAVFYHTMRQILSAGFERVLFAIIADDSGGRSHFGAEVRLAQRTYALYELNR